MLSIGEYAIDAPDWIKALLDKKAPGRPWRSYAFFRLYEADDRFPSLRDKTETFRAAVAGIAAHAESTFDLQNVWQDDITPKEMNEAGFEPVGAQWAQKFRLIAA